MTSNRLIGSVANSPVDFTSATNNASLCGIAREHLEEMAGELKQKWQEDYASLKKAS